MSRHLSKTEKFIVSILVCQLPGFLGFLVTKDSITTWYANLHKPVFSPPDWVFGVVWPILYTLMGISAFLIWVRYQNNSKFKSCRVFFILQLALNGLWSPIFFGLHNIPIALIDIILLWKAIFVTIRAFRKVSKTAAILLYPYLLWVSFAVILNAAMFYLNR
jgi:translocator protein